MGRTLGNRNMGRGAHLCLLVFKHCSLPVLKRLDIGYNMECRQRSQLYSELIPGALLLVVVFLYEESF